MGMRRIATYLLVALLAVAVSTALVACGGGGSTDPEAALHGLSEHRDQLEGELMLAEVELDQGYLATAEASAKSKPRRAARAIDGILREVKKIEHKCHEGNGLESCTELDPIEAVVKEIEQEARVGPTP
jgi:hypothetical protein